MNPIDEVAATLHLAKVAEAHATEARIEAEKALIALLPAKDEGAVSAAGDTYKVSVTYGVSRTLDVAVVAQLFADERFRWAAQRLFPMAPKLDTKELRFFQSNEPATYAFLAQAITAKPAKPSVKIEMIEREQQAA